MEMSSCPICIAQVRSSNLQRHLRKAHRLPEDADARAIFQESVADNERRAFARSRTAERRKKWKKTKRRVIPLIGQALKGDQLAWDQLIWMMERVDINKMIDQELSRRWRKDGTGETGS